MKKNSVYFWTLLIIVVGVCAYAQTPTLDEIKTTIRYRLAIIESIQFDYTRLTKDEFGGPQSEFNQKFPGGKKTVCHYRIKGQHPFFKKRLMIECTPNWKPLNYKAFDGKTSQRVYPNGRVEEKERLFAAFTEQSSPWWVIDRLTNHGRVEQLLNDESLHLESAGDLVKLVGNFDQYSYAELYLDPQKNFAIVKGKTGLRPDILIRPICHYKTFSAQQFEKVIVNQTEIYIPTQIRIEEHGRGDERVTFSHTMQVFHFEINQNYPDSLFDLVSPDLTKLGLKNKSNQKVIDQINREIANLELQSATTVQAIFSQHSNNNLPQTQAVRYKLSDPHNVTESTHHNRSFLTAPIVSISIFTMLFIGISLFVLWIKRSA